MNIEELVLKKPKFLIVDDVSTVRKIMVKFLTKLGFSDFTEANDGVDAIEKSNSTSFDIIISDIEMPRLNGLQLYASLKDRDKSPKAYILITSHADKKMVETAFNEGITNYVLKPFDESILRIKLLEAYKE
jgi:two-component system chemotaxis response regulator CheY